MNHPELPRTPDELLQMLFAIFPAFRECYSGPFHDGEPSFHSVLHGFLDDFGGELPSQPQHHLRLFAELINAAVAQPGEVDSLENAFGTCYLEHLHQWPGGEGETLWPYLSPTAQALTYP